MNLLEFLEKCDEDKTKVFPVHVMQISKEAKDDYVTIKIPLPSNVIKNPLEIKDWVMYIIATPKREYAKIFQE